MKFPKKLIAFGLSLCMSVVPCGPVAAEDFTDAQTDMTDAIDTFTDDGNSEESENTVNTDQITEEEFPGSDIGTETDEAESSESEEIQQDSDEGFPVWMCLCGTGRPDLPFPSQKEQSTCSCRYGSGNSFDSDPCMLCQCLCTASGLR